MGAGQKKKSRENEGRKLLGDSSFRLESSEPQKSRSLLTINLKNPRQSSNLSRSRQAWEDHWDDGCKKIQNENIKKINKSVYSIVKFRKLPRATSHIAELLIPTLRSAYHKASIFFSLPAVYMYIRNISSGIWILVLESILSSSTPDWKASSRRKKSKKLIWSKPESGDFETFLKTHLTQCALPTREIGEGRGLGGGKYRWSTNMNRVNSAGELIWRMNSFVRIRKNLFPTLTREISWIFFSRTFFLHLFAFESREITASRIPEWDLYKSGELRTLSLPSPYSSYPSFSLFAAAPQSDDIRALVTCQDTSASTHERASTKSYSVAHQPIRRARASRTLLYLCNNCPSLSKIVLHFATIIDCRYNDIFSLCTFFSE